MFAGVDEGRDHDAVSHDGRRCSLLLFVSRLASFFASISNGVWVYPSVAFLDNVHEWFECRLAFHWSEGCGFDWVIDLVVMELG